MGDINDDKVNEIVRVDMNNEYLCKNLPTHNMYFALVFLVYVISVYKVFFSKVQLNQVHDVRK